MNPVDLHNSIEETEMAAFETMKTCSDKWMQMRMRMILNILCIMRSFASFTASDLRLISDLSQEVCSFHRKIYNINMPPLGTGRDLTVGPAHKQIKSKSKKRK
jgi:hypothetical protein